MIAPLLITSEINKLIGNKNENKKENIINN